MMTGLAPGYGHAAERGERRTAVSIIAEVTDPQEATHPVMIVDISASGARIHTDLPVLDGPYHLHFGVYGVTYSSRFDIARHVEEGENRYWGVHFLDLSADEITDLRRSVNVIAGEGGYELFEWDDIMREIGEGREEVRIGFTSTGEEVLVSPAFVLSAGVEGLHTYMDARESGRTY